MSTDKGKGSLCDPCDGDLAISILRLLSANMAVVVVMPCKLPVREAHNVVKPVSKMHKKKRVRHEGNIVPSTLIQYPQGTRWC